MADVRIKDLEDIKLVFNKYNVPFFIVYGALLGFYRDGDFLPGDDDIDLAVTANIDLKTRKAIGWALFDLGFVPQDIAFNVFGRMEPSEVGYNGDSETGIIVCKRNFKFTIFFFKTEGCSQHGSEFLCVPKLGAMKLISTPAKFFVDDSDHENIQKNEGPTRFFGTNPKKKYETIKIGKTKYLAPTPIKDYLAFTYFNNWKDKTDRRHGDTYFTMHASNDASLDIEGKNEVTIYK